MTTSDDTDRTLALQWHPDALRPPFRWAIDLPTDWSVLDTHPARWKRQAERITDDAFGGIRLRAAHRREVLDYLTSVVAAAQNAKMMLVLMKVGLSQDGSTPEALGLTLRWASSSPLLASMATITGMKGAPVTQITTARGLAAGIRTDHRRETRGGELTTVSSVQGFLPMPGTSWTLILTTTAPRTDLDDSLIALVTRCLGSVHILDSTQEDVGTTPQAGEAAAATIDGRNVTVAERHFTPDTPSDT